MTSAVVLPRIAWGDPRANRRVLLVHGLGSNAPLMWRYGVALADAGWYAEAPDLRGHGHAPRTLDYTLAAYGADVAATRPADAAPWDLALGHSLGGAAVTVAAAADPAWASRIVLVDPAIQLSARDHELVRRSQEESFDEPAVDAIRAQRPHWHEQDIELKAQSVRQSSHWGIIATMEQNDPWDVRADAARLAVPTHVIASDPAVYSLFHGALAEEVLRNPRITMSVLAGAGHVPHRDMPDATIAELFRILN